MPATSLAAANQAEIRDAACVIVIDHEKPEPALLMGRRHANQVFLPDKWVFPGGRVDEADRTFAQSFPEPYLPRDLVAELRPFALAAVRELYEEAGMLIGTDDATAHPHADCWPAFRAAGHVPAPVHLSPLARAITPPGRVRRYDTWFFTAPRAAVANIQSSPDGELLDLDWFTVDDARKLDLPSITRLVLDDVSQRLQSPPQKDVRGSGLPFYYEDACGLQRTLISCTMPQRTP